MSKGPREEELDLLEEEKEVSVLSTVSTPGGRGTSWAGLGKSLGGRGKEQGCR